MQRQQVAEDARERDDHVDARAAQLSEAHQFGACQTPVAVETGPGTHERQSLSNRPAFAFEVVGAPQHHGNRLGQRMARLHVLGQQPVCLAGAVLDRISTRDAEGVEAVQIAAGGQDLGRAQQVPARGGAQ